MNNLISYDNFLNEGIFRSDEDDIAQKFPLAKIGMMKIWKI